MTKFALLLVVSVALTLLLPEIFKIKIRTSSPSVTSSSEILHHVNTEEQLYQAQESIRDQLKSDPDTNITVLIAPGNYYNISLVLTKDDSPDPNSIVKFAAEDDSSPPTLHGGVLIPETDWTKSPSSPIWSAPLPPHMTDSHGRATFRTLTQDSLSANLASSPDVNSGYLNVTDFDQGGFTYSQGALPQKMDCEKSQCVVFTRAGYSSNFRKVLKINASKPRVEMSSEGFEPSTGQNYIAGALELLDNEGEWAVRDHTLFFWPFSVGGVDVDLNSNVVVTVVQNQKVVEFIGSAHHIELSNVRFVGSDVPLEYAFSCETNPQYGGAPCRNTDGDPKAVDLQNATPLKSASGLIFASNASNIFITSCEILAAGVAGIWLQERASNFTIVNNTVRDVAGFGLYANGVGPGDTRFLDSEDADVNRHHKIVNNTFDDGGKQILYGSGVWLFQSNHNTIMNNVISRFARDAVGIYGIMPYMTARPDSPDNFPLDNGVRKYWGKYLSWYGGGDNEYAINEVLFAHNNLVAYNDVYLCNRAGLDGGIFETWGVGHNNTFEYNSVHDNEGNGALSVFFADDFSPTTTFHSNVAFENNCPARGFSNCAVFMIKSVNESVTNNIVADSNISQVFEIDHVSIPMGGVVIRNNIVVNTTQRELVLPPSVYCDDERITKGSACDSYYAMRSCDENRLGGGLNYWNANLSVVMNTTTGGQRQQVQQYGFSDFDLRGKAIIESNSNVYDDARMIGRGACKHFDSESQINNDPWKVNGKGWWEKDLFNYEYEGDEEYYQKWDFSLVGHDGGNAHVRGGVDAFRRIEAENYDRTKNLWTTERLGLGFSVDHFSSEGVEPVPAGSWARYDMVNFGRGGGGVGGLEIDVFARGVFGGARILFVVDSPEPNDWTVVAEVNVDEGGEEFLHYKGEVKIGEMVGVKTIFMIFEGEGDVGAVVDYFRFRRM